MEIFKKEDWFAFITFSACWLGLGFTLAPLGGPHSVGQKHLCMA